MEQQAQQQNQQTEKVIGFGGWLIPFDIVIGTILNTIFGTTFFNIIGIIFCFSDNEILKRFKGVKISFWRCLLPPTYLYKRAILLKEPMTKFQIGLVFYILATFMLGLFFLATVSGIGLIQKLEP